MTKQEKRTRDLELADEFSKGWKHFCSRIDFGRSFLDAEAIRFMNEVPDKVVRALRSQ